MDGGVLGTIVGSIIGFLASLLPEVFALLRERNQRSQQSSTAGTNGEVVGEHVQERSPYSPDESADDALHYVALDYLRASVRPVITYLFFASFIVMKFIVLYYAVYIERTPVTALLPVVWDEGTDALFAAVVSFWFGTRALARIRRKR